MSDENLQAQWDAAIVGGDLATLERIGPQLFPEDNAPLVAPARIHADAPRALPADVERQQHELYGEMSKTHPGSTRMKELESSLEALLKQRYPEPTPAEVEARPTPAAAARVLPADGERRQREIYAALATVNPGSARAVELQTQLEQILQAQYPEGTPTPGPRDALPSEPTRDGTAAADVDESALAVSPETLRWAAGTPPAVQRAFSALAGELGVSVSEAQAAHDAIAQAPWLPAEEFHRVMAAEWGADYADNLRRVAGELQALHGPLRDQIEARMADDVFSPELARRLESLPTLRGQGRRG